MDTYREEMQCERHPGVVWPHPVDGWPDQEESEIVISGSAGPQQICAGPGMPWKVQYPCAKPGCLAEAAFLALTVRRENGDGIMAGPDPYSDSVHACEAHVGELLGHQPTCRNPEEIYWHVAPISWDPYVTLAPPHVEVTPGHVSPVS